MQQQRNQIFWMNINIHIIRLGHTSTFSWRCRFSAFKATMVFSREHCSWQQNIHQHPHHANCQLSLSSLTNFLWKSIDRTVKRAILKINKLASHGLYKFWSYEWWYDQLQCNTLIGGNKSCDIHHNRMIFCSSWRSRSDHWNTNFSVHHCKTHPSSSRSNLINKSQ